MALAAFCVVFVLTLCFLVDCSKGKNQNDLVCQSVWAECFVLATGQPTDWEGAQPGPLAVEKWKDGESGDIQSGAQQPGLSMSRSCVCGVSFP